MSRISPSWPWLFCFDSGAGLYPHPARDTHLACHPGTGSTPPWPVSRSTHPHRHLDAFLYRRRLHHPARYRHRLRPAPVRRPRPSHHMGQPCSDQHCRWPYPGTPPVALRTSLPVISFSNSNAPNGSPATAVAYSVFRRPSALPPCSGARCWTSKWSASSGPVSPPSSPS